MKTCVLLALLAVAWQAEARLAVTGCPDQCVIDAGVGAAGDPFGFKAHGEITVDKDNKCSVLTGGDVSVEVYIGGQTITGTVTVRQSNECDANQEPVWSLFVDLGAETIPLPAPADSIVVTGATLDLTATTTAAGTTFSGTLAGSVTLAGTTTLAATITVSPAGTLSSVILDADQASLGPLTLSDLQFSLDGSTLQGSGTAALDLTAEGGPALPAATIETLTHDTQDGSWAFAASLGDGEAFDVMGISLSGVAVDLTRSKDGEWAGSIGGRAELFGDGNSIEVSAAYSTALGLEHLTGTATISGSGVTVTGTAEVSRGSAGLVTTITDCAVTLPEVTATGQLTYNHGTKEFSVAAELDGSLKIGEVTVSKASLALEKSGAGAWSGTVSGSASVFGGTADASISFADGKLQTLRVATVFSAGKGLFTGELSFDYVKDGDCPVSTGTSSGVFKVSGASDLSYENAVVTYNACTGKVTVDATVSGAWKAPGAVEATSVTISIASSGNAPGAKNTKLADQAWVGTLTAATSAGLTVTTTVDTSTTTPSVSARIAYEDSNVDIDVGVASDCTGSGTVLVKDVEHLPSFEFRVTFSKAVCDKASKAWVLTGSLAAGASAKTISFFGKTLPLGTPTITVMSNEAGAKTVSISGTAFGEFVLEASFGIQPFSGFALKAYAAADGASPSPASWLEGVSGASPFGSGAGSSATGLFDAVNAVGLRDVVASFDFQDKEIALLATGDIGGAEFDVIVSVKKVGSSWKVALLVETTGLDTLSLPGLAGEMVAFLAPSHLLISVANQQTTVSGRTIKAGLSFSATLPMNAGVMKAISAVSPKSLMDKASAASVNGGVTVSAILTSGSVEMLLDVSGGQPIRFSSAVELRQLAISVVLATGQSPEFGFKTTIAITMDDRVLEASALLAVDAKSLILAVDVTSDNPVWDKPFGIPGVKIHLPLGLRIGLTPALPFISEFALTGEVQVAKATGSITLAINLAEPTQNAFRMEILKFNLPEMLEAVTGCTTCTNGVAGVLLDVSADRVLTSVNPDPVNPVSVKFASITETIEPGIHLEIENLKVWKVIHVVKASFHADASGVAASFEAKPVNWGGVVQIHSVGNRNKGPMFDMKMTKSERRLKVDGEATILGQKVAIYMLLSDASIYGRFHYSLFGALSVDALVESNNGKHKVSATFESDIIKKMIDAATAFLKDLSKAAREAIEDAKKDVRSANSAFDDAMDALQDAKKEAKAGIDAAQADVNKAKREVDSFDCGDIWLISDACELGKKIAKGALSLANEALEIAEDAAVAILDAATVIVDESRIVLDWTEDVLTWAQGATKVFDGVVDAVGNVLSNVLRVKRLHFEGELSSSSIAVGFDASLVVFGNDVDFGFDVELDFDKIVNKIKNMVEDAFMGDYDKVQDSKPAPAGSTKEDPKTVAEFVKVLRSMAYHMHYTKTTIKAEVERDCKTTMTNCNNIKLPSIFPKSTIALFKQKCRTVMTARCNEAKERADRQVRIATMLKDAMARKLAYKFKSPAQNYVKLGAVIPQAEKACQNVKEVLKTNVCKKLKLCPPTAIICNLPNIYRAARASMLKNLKADGITFVSSVVQTAHNATVKAKAAQAAQNEIDTISNKCKNPTKPADIIKCAAEMVQVAVKSVVAFTLKGVADASANQKKNLDVVLFDLLEDAGGRDDEANKLIISNLKNGITNHMNLLNSLLKKAKGGKCSNFDIICKVAKARGAGDINAELTVAKDYYNRMKVHF